MWNLTYTPTNSSSNPGNSKVVIIRTGFSTHCVSPDFPIRIVHSGISLIPAVLKMNFGQRYLELATSYTQESDTGLVTLHISQMPPNANIFQPGPAMIFLVVDGIPSQGQVRGQSKPIFLIDACAR